MQNDVEFYTDKDDKKTEVEVEGPEGVPGGGQALPLHQLLGRASG